MNISKDEMRFKDGCDETRIIQLSIFKIFFVLQGVPKKTKTIEINIQGESKKSDAFCYSNLPRVTCC